MFLYIDFNNYIISALIIIFYFIVEFEDNSDDDPNYEISDSDSSEIVTVKKTGASKSQSNTELPCYNRDFHASLNDTEKENENISNNYAYPLLSRNQVLVMIKTWQLWNLDEGRAIRKQIFVFIVTKNNRK